MIQGLSRKEYSVYEKEYLIKFEDDEDPPSEDEDGEETSVFKGGMFANQGGNSIAH